MYTCISIKNIGGGGGGQQSSFVKYRKGAVNVFCKKNVQIMTTFNSLILYHGNQSFWIL